MRWRLHSVCMTDIWDGETFGMSDDVLSVIPVIRTT